MNSQLTKISKFRLNCSSIYVECLSTDIFRKNWGKVFVAKNIWRLIASEAENPGYVEKSVSDDQNIYIKSELKYILYTPNVFLNTCHDSRVRGYFVFCDRAWLNVNGLRRRYDMTSELNTISPPANANTIGIKEMSSWKILLKRVVLIWTPAPMHFLFDWFYLIAVKCTTRLNFTSQTQTRLR